MKAQQQINYKRLTRSRAQAKPPSVASHVSEPAGGSPLSATMFRMPFSCWAVRIRSETGCEVRERAGWEGRGGGGSGGSGGSRDFAG